MSRYVIVYPHRIMSQKRISEFGDIVHRQSMRMTGMLFLVKEYGLINSILINLQSGKRYYECVVVKMRHKGAARDDIDQDVEHALEILRDQKLYDAYIERKGAAMVPKIISTVRFD